VRGAVCQALVDECWEFTSNVTTIKPDMACGFPSLMGLEIIKLLQTPVQSQPGFSRFTAESDTSPQILEGGVSQPVFDHQS
jgi:hypothetical protein